MRNESILLRNAGKTWKKDFAEVFLFGIPKWFNVLPGLYESEVLKIKERYFSDNGKFIVLLRYRKHGQLNIGNKKHLLTYFPDRYHFKALLICLLPRHLAKLLSSCLKKIIR
jgi:hypothetical protein